MPGFIKKSSAATGKLIIAIHNNDYESFKSLLGDSYLNIPAIGYFALHEAIGLGRSKMVSDIAKSLRDQEIKYNLSSKFQFCKEPYPFNVLQAAAMFCNVDAVKSLVDLCRQKYNEQDVCMLLKDSGIIEATGSPLLSSIINTLSATNIEACTGFDPSIYKNTKEVEKVRKLLFGLQRKNVKSEPAIIINEGQSTSDSSTDVSDHSNESIKHKNPVDVIWVGPYLMIEYLLTIPGFDVADAHDLGMVSFVRELNDKATESNDVSRWEFLVKDKFMLRSATIESFSIDPVTNMPVMIVTLKDPGEGNGTIQLRLSYSMSEINDLVKAKLDFAKSREGLVRKQSLERVEKEVTTLKSKWEQTPEGMDQAIRAALAETPELQDFYVKFFMQASRELKTINVHGKDYFAAHNLKYQIAVAAISLAGETQGVVGNVAARSATAALGMLVSYQGTKQAAEVFKLSSAVHPEQLIAVSVSYALTKLLKDKIMSGDINIKQVKDAFIDVIKNLHKHSIGEGSDAFEQIAQKIVTKLNQRPGACCTIS